MLGSDFDVRRLPKSFWLGVLLSERPRARVYFDREIDTVILPQDLRDGCAGFRDTAILVQLTLPDLHVDENGIKFRRELGGELIFIPWPSVYMISDEAGIHGVEWPEADPTRVVH